MRLITIDQARQLSPVEINRVIAQGTGWTYSGGGWWLTPSQRTIANVPDYFHDLNACYKAENSLRKCEVEDYMYEVTSLFTVLNGRMAFFMHAPANIRAIALAVVLSQRKEK